MIAHSSSTLGEREAEAARRCVEENYVSRGPAARELEAALASSVGRRHAFVVSSGFHALGLALSALDLPVGSEVALPVLTCASVPAAISRTGHRPVLCDIEPGFLTLDPAAVPPSSRAIVAPHAYGNPLDADALGNLGLPWIEDCATSPASAIGGRPCGSFGTLAIFSFNGTKYVTAGGGGAVLCDDDLFAARIAALLDADAPYKRELWNESIPSPWPGWLPDLNAAVALAQWRRLDEFRQCRQSLADLYHAALFDADAGIRPLPARPGHSYYRFLVRTELPAEARAEALRASGIDARSQVNPWLDEHFGTKGDFPVADSIRRNLLSLPIHPGMKLAEIERVIAALIQTK